MEKALILSTNSTKILDKIILNFKINNFRNNFNFKNR